jgi:hypothetical protein
MDLKGQIADKSLQRFLAKAPPQWHFDLKQSSEMGWELRQVQEVLESSSQPNVSNGSRSNCQPIGSSTQELT